MNQIVARALERAEHGAHADRAGATPPAAPNLRTPTGPDAPGAVAPAPERQGAEHEPALDQTALPGSGARSEHPPDAPIARAEPARAEPARARRVAPVAVAPESSGPDLVEVWHELDEHDDGDHGEPPEGRWLRSVLEWGAVILGALVVALLIKTFLLQAYYIPSQSMQPTLEVSDRVLVNKLSYNFNDISRGDLVVFKRPANEPGDIDDLIKRVVALEGETINIVDGQILIDGRLLVEPYIADGVRSGPIVDTSRCVNDLAVEGCTIPEGHVYVMGDNRGDSRDSRWFGPVEEGSIVGRAFLKVWPLTNIGFL